mgnify:CR=1 FL=1
MKFDGIIFDWAGTTVDYGSFAPVKAFIEAFEAFGITPSLEEVRKPMGMLKIDHVRTMMTMDRINRLWIEKHGVKWTEKDVLKVYELSEKKILEIVSNFAYPKPYVVDTVRKIRELGLKIGSTTGYTREMMEIVVPKANEFGYSPDYWCSPDDVGNYGRPYPYMIFRNMKELKLDNVQRVIKVGDTVADIKEGKNAGLITAGIIEGSSVVGLTENEFNALTSERKRETAKKAADIYINAGADFVIDDIRGILDIIE